MGDLKMKRSSIILLLFVILVFTSFFSSCSSYNVEKDGIPKFVDTQYIELDKIEKISKFRSAAGHDYSDDFESCRSMKHYYQPYDTLIWNDIKVYSPVAGSIVRIREEWAGTQLEIRSDEYPAFSFIIFHMDLLVTPKIGDKLTKGQQLGTHIGTQTTSDIAVGVNTPRGYKLVSYFDLMTDSLFAAYQERGLSTRSDVIITKEERDADPLICVGDEGFTTQGTLENWIIFE
jgi:hypothetical protein